MSNLQVAMVSQTHQTDYQYYCIAIQLLVWLEGALAGYIIVSLSLIRLHHKNASKCDTYDVIMLHCCV